MTKDEVIVHWQEEARDAVETAEVLLKARKYKAALFNCHLAAELALKSQYLAEKEEDFPYTHDLQKLASALGRSCSEEELEALEQLSDFAVAARYSDPAWAEQYATKANAERWVEWVAEFISRILP